MNIKYLKNKKQKTTDEYFMSMAIKEAKKALYPFGAIIVKNGKILVKAGSGEKQEKNYDPTAHAEINAIRKACKKIKSKKLTGLSLYSSCEPCALCFAAAWYADIESIIYSMSIEDIEKIDKNKKNLILSKKYTNTKGIKIQKGILRKSAINMYTLHAYGKD